MKKLVAILAIGLVVASLSACVPRFRSDATIEVTPGSSGTTIRWPGAAVGLDDRVIDGYQVLLDGTQIAYLPSPARSCLLVRPPVGTHSVTVVAKDSEGALSSSGNNPVHLTTEVTITSPPGPGSPTCTLVPIPTTNRTYMTDHVELNALPPSVEQVAVSTKMNVRGCSDIDSCPNGVRASTGYVWFAALAVNLGPSPTDPTYYGMHGGLAYGGSGQRSKMYLDWSGYCPASLGGKPLRHGGSSCAIPNSNPTQKPHTVVDLDPTHWYRLVVRKVSCSVSEVFDVSGPLTGWELVLTDETTGIEQSGGTWCLPNAPAVAHAYLFDEVIESRGPCATDLASVEWKNPAYRTGSSWIAFPNAWGHYNGNESSFDADCADTNIRVVAPNHVIDERGVPRGTAGGIPSPGWNVLY